MSCRVFSFSRPGSHWAQVAWLWFVCVLPWTAWPAKACAQTARPPALESSIELLRKADATLTALEENFAKRSAELSPLQETLRQADETLTQLEQLWPQLNERVLESGRRLAQAQKQLDELRSELTALRAALTLWQETSAEWERASVDSQAALTKAQSSLDALTERYDALLLSWQEYRTEVQVQSAARELAVRRWRTVAIFGILGALAGGFLAGVLVK